LNNLDNYSCVFFISILRKRQCKCGRLCACYDTSICCRDMNLWALNDIANWR